MYYAQSVAKAVAAILAVILGSGILTGRWLTDTELILAAINGVTVWAVPNRAKAISAPVAPKAP
jgi:hypothetical protein